MPRQNRIDPWGDLRAVADRGMFTGNRGCLVDDDRVLVRHHASSLWIVCLTDYQGRRHELDRPHHWTPLFFLDDAVALAAGHRPCGLCRREAYLAYRRAVTEGLGGGWRLDANQLNRRLAAERLTRGRGLDRRADRRLWPADTGSLPPGTVVVDIDGRALLLWHDAAHPFGFDGWGRPEVRPCGLTAVLTPPTSVLALANGFAPVVHPSAAGAG